MNNILKITVTALAATFVLVQGVSASAEGIFTEEVGDNDGCPNLTTDSHFYKEARMLFSSQGNPFVVLNAKRWKVVLDSFSSANHDHSVDSLVMLEPQQVHGRTVCSYGYIYTDQSMHSTVSKILQERGFSHSELYAKGNFF